MLYTYTYSLENNISTLFICFQSPIRSWSWKRRPAPRCRSTFSAWRDPSRIWRSTRRSTSTTSPIRQVLEWNFVLEYLLTIQIANRKTKANTTYCHYQTAPNAIDCWLRKQSTVGASINIFAHILDSHPIYTIFIHIDWSCFCCPSKHTRGRAPAKRTILKAAFARFTQQRALCLDAHIYHKTNHQNKHFTINHISCSRDTILAAYYNFSDAFFSVKFLLLDANIYFSLYWKHDMKTCSRK